MNANSSQCTITSELHLRPHHLLCLQTFVGRGYSEEFITENLIAACCPGCEWRALCIRESTSRQRPHNTLRSRYPLP